ncbi:MAG TPA: energy transducer TonB [Bryobacteraceae bacterium]|jgi:TonB family protein
MQPKCVHVLFGTLISAGLCFGADSLPVPADPHELVTGPVQIASTPADRAAAFGLLERAKQNADMHMLGMSPFNVKINFSASGSSTFNGPGTITELWFSGRQWRYDQSLAGYSEARVSTNGRMAAKGIESLPLRVAMLRSAMFWPVGGNPSNFGLRTASSQWNAHPVTCLLLSGMQPAPTPTRLWEETEYCVDNTSGLLQIFSRAPGTYVVYGYAGNLQFHGRQVPDQITMYVAGKSVLDGSVSIADANPADATLVTPDSSMVSTQTNGMNMRLSLPVGAPVAGATVKPVIVNVTIDRQGRVAEAEVSAASDPSLANSALDAVKKMNFGPSESWRQAYINVRFFSGAASSGAN